MFVRLPQDYAKSTRDLKCSGNESWASNYLYPNGWTMATFKTIVMRESPGQLIHEASYGQPFLFLVLFTILLSAIFNTFYL